MAGRSIPLSVQSPYTTHVQVGVNTRAEIRLAYHWWELCEGSVGMHSCWERVAII
jgi:hypothetical protein